MFKIVFLITTASFLMGAKSCKYDVEGNTVGKIYPTHNVVRTRVIQQSCPLQVSETQNMPIDSNLDGWCVVPPNECAKYFTDYEAKVCD